MLSFFVGRTEKNAHHLSRVVGVLFLCFFSFFIANITFADVGAAGKDAGSASQTTTSDSTKNVGAEAPVIGGLLALDFLFQTFADIAFTIAGILTQGIVLMIDLMVPIMTYNSFVTNPVVSAGWAIMRDTVNMFFVIVLIIIAFGTIFGHSKFQWSQQVPKLLLFAIVINFSKTLCGLMIDFGQVIMLTFANALREIAAGNFIQLLGLNQLYSVSQNTEAARSVTDAAGATIKGADYLGAGVMSVLLTMWVLGTLIMMVVILLYRIIGLWILVVVAPLAWFVGGAGGSSGIIQSDAYSKWWDRFKCLVGIGPVLTFFLWLTLAVAGAGSIAANSGFAVSSANASDLGSKLLEPQNFMSFLIGMALLFAGFDAAQQLCSSLSGGVLGKSLQRARSGALQKGALALGLKGTGKGLQLGARGARRLPGAAATVASYMPMSAAASRMYGQVRQSVKTGIGGAMQQAGKVAGALYVPGGKALERGGVSYKASAKAQAGLARTEDMKQAKEGLKGKTREEKLDLMKTFANQAKSGLPLSVKDDAQYTALLDETMGDKRMQKEARATGLLKAVWKQKGNAFQKDHTHDAAKLDQINDFKKANADITKSAGLISDWDDAKGLNDDALKDKDVKARLKNVKTTVRDNVTGQYMNAFDAIAEGHAGATKQKALVTEKAERYERMTDQELARVSVQTLVTGSKDSPAATSAGMQKAIEASMRTGDEGRARSLMSHLGVQVHGGKTPEDRAQAYNTIQSINRSVRTMAPSGTTDLFDRVKRAADEIVGRRSREEAQASIRRLSTQPPTEGAESGPTPVVVEQVADSEAAAVAQGQQVDSEAATVVSPRT